MDRILIFQPLGVLVALTFLVLAFIPLRRFQAVLGGRLGRDDFKFGESARVPGEVSIPNRNYMNLLELPMLFYVACLAMFVADRVTALQLYLAWAYVGLRAAHSFVHMTFNAVIVRLTFFALSNFVLMAIWLVFFFGPQS